MNGITNEAVASIYEIALTFPDPPKVAISRESQLDTLDSIFSADVDCLFLEGVAEIGKTSLCAQFARRHADTAFSLFLGPYRHVTSDAAQIRFDIANQVNWYLKGERLPDNAEVALEELRSLLMLLERKVKLRKITAYMVLDSIEVPPNAEGFVIDYLFSVLPFGKSGFKFLMAGNLELIPDYLRKRLRIRQQTVAPFSTSESAQYLSDLGLSPEEMGEVQRTTRGVPGRLATIRRRLDAGECLHEILGSQGSGLRDYFGPEWAQVSTSNRLQLDSLAALAFLPECQSVPVLCEVIGAAEHETRESLRDLTFLAWSKERDEVAYVSDSFQNYARKQLEGRETAILERAVIRMHGNEDPREALRLLPQYLKKNQNLERLRGLLVGAKVATAVKRAKSGGQMLRALDEIRSVASDGAREAFAISSAIMRVVVSESMSPAHAHSRIRAFVAEGKDTEALQLANSIEVDECRLSCLSEFLESQKEAGRDNSPELVDEVGNLIEQLDLSAMGDAAFDVAASLMNVRPDLAARAMEAYARAEGDANSLDRAFVRLSLKTMVEARTTKDASRLAASMDRIAPSEAVKKLTREAMFIIDGGTKEEVLHQISSFKTTSEKIYFARSWLRANPKSEFASSVAVAAARLLIGDTKYAPNAKVFRDLASPLVYAGEGAESKDLMSVLQGQCANAQSAGPLVDFYRLRFRMAIARVRWHGSQGIVDLFEDALQIDELPDADTRSACFAWLVRCAEEIRKIAPCPDEIGLRGFAVQRLSKALEDVLKGSAEHGEAARGALSAMAPYALDEAIQLSLRLNTERRRDNALAYVAERYLEDAEATSVEVVCSNIARIVQHIKGRRFIQSAVVSIADWLASRKVALDDDGLRTIQGIACHVYDPELRLILLAQMIRSANERKTRVVVDVIWASLVDTWESIDDLSRRLEAGCRAVARIGSERLTEFPAFASRLGDLGRAQADVLERQVVWRYLTLLYGRSLAAVAATGPVDDTEVDGLVSVSRNVLSGVERARLLGRAVLYIAVFDQKIASRAVGRALLPVVNEAIASSVQLTTSQERMLEEVFPAIWLFNQASAKQYLRKLEPTSRDRALDFALDFVMKRRVPREPWSEPDSLGGVITQEVVDEVMDLLSEVSADHILADQVDALLKRVGDRTAGARINKTQRGSLVQSIRELAAKKLPDPRGILHEGYLILIDGYLLEFNGTQHAAPWQALVERGREVPNDSDRCFVLTSLYASMSVREGSMRRALLEEILETWRMLPSVDEKLGRLFSIFEWCRTDLGPRIRPLIEDCLRVYDVEGSSAMPGGRRLRMLVEMAHKVDEEWAASLVSIADQDPAREAARLEAREGIEQLKLSKAVSTPEQDGKFAGSPAEVAAACARELGVMSGCGSTSLGWADIMHRLSVLPLAELSVSFPVLSYAMAAFAYRYRNVPNMRERAQMLLRAVNEAVVVGASMSGRSGGGSRDQGELSEIASGGPSLNRVVRTGDRGDVLDAVSTWVARRRPEILEVVDPYLRAEDIADILSLVRNASPDTAVRFLTSLKVQPKPWSAESLESSILSAYERGGGIGNPPTAVVIAVGTSAGEMSIHDRWWLSGDEGLEFGTSFGSLGVDRLSSAKVVDATVAEEVRAEVRPYFNMIVRHYKGDRLSYLNVVL